jgi:Tfp pilus assembly protein PilN
MIRQQINLYTAEFRRGEQPLSARLIARASVGMLLVLLAVEAVAVWQLHRARGGLEHYQAEESVVSRRVQALKSSQGVDQRSGLEQQIEILRREVQRREELKMLVGGQNLGNASGFSPYMEAMARQASEDLSLTRIGLLNGGSYLELEGWTRKPEAVPFYLRKLRDEDSFQDVKFGVLGIKKDNEYSHKMQFHLGKPDGGSS